MEIRSSHTCPCCGSNNITLAYENSFFNLPILKCGDCSLHYDDHSKNNNDIKEYHAEKYWSVFRNINNEKISDQKIDQGYPLKKFPKFIQTIAEMTGVRKSLAFSQYNYLKSFLHGNNLLEIGAGEGYLLEFFEKKGYQVYGIEPSKVNLEVINKKLKNGKCDVGFVENLVIPDKKFDVIVMSHVLEHLSDGKLVLFSLKNVLADKGILFIEVPNCQNKETLEHSIDTQPHLFHFTKQSLQKLIEQANLKVLKADTYTSKVFSFKDHLRYMTHWILKKDFYSPSSEYDGNRLRIIATHADK